MRPATCLVMAVLLAAAARAGDDADGRRAAVKVVRSSVGEGKLAVTLTVDWAASADLPRADQLSLVFLFIDERPPYARLHLGPEILGRMSAACTSGTLKDGRAWVLREAVHYEYKRSGGVLQIVVAEGKGEGAEGNERADFRRGGEYAVEMSLPRVKVPKTATTDDYRDLPTVAVYVGLFENADPEKGPDKSTRYRPVSNVVLLPAD